ncbi:MAG: HAMP domain-containing sensor histidine kinase, partial [Bacteroidota bacterium]
MPTPVAEPPALPVGLLAALGIATLERLPDGRFSLLGDLPDWFTPFAASGDTPGDAFGARGPIDLAEVSDFLAHFLPSAEAVWDGGGPERRMSGPFTEWGADGEERTLEATALVADGRAMLLLGPPTMTFSTTQRLLQTARDERLDLERTRRRTEEREVLLHCIVHDLANPLAGLRGGLRMLDASGLSDDDRELLAIARRQAERMQTMIGDVLDTFRQEVDAMMPATAAPADAAHALRESADALRPRATLTGVTLHVDAPEAPLRTVADARRLERVVMNLTENAIRHSPKGGAVRLSARASGGDVVLAVEDDGPGVAPEVVGDLFRRFRPRGAHRGQSGLGLYFCRLAAES